MNRIIIIFLVIFTSCSDKKEFEKPIRISPPIIEFDKGRIPKIALKEYYFHENDSSKLNLQKITKFYSVNQIASESHLLTSSSTEKGRKIFYDYKDSLLVQKRTVNEKKDSTKVVYSYNNRNQLIKREYFTFKKRLRPEIIEKQRESTDCIISETDYEENRSWDKISEIDFSYDSIDRKTQYYAPNLHWDNQNKYKWFYDEKGNIKIKESWNHNELIWTENYSYENNEYSFTRNWNNEDTQKEFKFFVYKNKFGQKIKEVTMKNDSIQQSKKTYEYYKNGMIKRKVVYGESDKRLTTYIYKK
ncbi:hypothetical protein P8625_03120 [Tenacibaculum tangerinum]|uniref:Sugar-binding protein n=1 Tax=Tenacibaculum tangerinum TaxID=3038772 RepID=A0ABY8L4I3_9FLAO|nr:hypothetical protein [Tenacibaculum tangerinum]WGH76174.1 hypothetical protein P8625_03120 [Tenacibaculum tangerinum]